MIAHTHAQEREQALSSLQDKTLFLSHSLSSLSQLCKGEGEEEQERAGEEADDVACALETSSTFPKFLSLLFSLCSSPPSLLSSSPTTSPYFFDESTTFSLSLSPRLTCKLVAHLTDIICCFLMWKAKTYLTPFFFFTFCLCILASHFDRILRYFIGRRFFLLEIIPGEKNE